ncbi:MAG: hypothetical protein HKN00_12165 [Flavobacteriaceae bacterium]|nr:hypothetical protein [Bacteroidia bacterium]NNF75935.1 hypothetical protein [Flavobacteriaceae bacterium]NNK72091.1 hypothetical protein [Flavobacteriaceae bacterium]
MVFNDIEKLIERYENAETTIQEEEQLKRYFSQETVEPHLEVYKPMFAYFAQTQNEQFTKDVPLKTKKTYVLYQWISVAAVVVIMLGLVFTNPFESSQRTFAELTPQEQQDYEKAMQAFNLLSSNFKKGTDNITAISRVSEAFDQGQEKFNRLNEFDNATDRIFKYE